MPKTILGTKAKKYGKLVFTIKGAVGMSEKNVPEIADMADISDTTFRRRLAHPEEFTLGELTAIGRGLGIPIEDLRQAIMY